MDDRSHRSRAGAAALLRDNRPRVFTLFALFAIDLSLFSLAEFLQRWQTASFGYVFWERVIVVAGSLLPASALAFFLEFLGVARRPARRARNTMLAGALSGLIVAASPLIQVKLAKIFVSTYVLGGLAAVLSVLWGKMHAAPTRVEKKRRRA